MDKTKITSVWYALSDHCNAIANLKVRDQFKSDPKRFSKFSLKAAGIFLDYSKNRVIAETMQLLFDLAKAAEVFQRRDEMFNGQKINTTENRAVLHPQLRNVHDQSSANGKLVTQSLHRITTCVTSIRDGKWHGYNGKAITDVVNIGIGGSDFGPAMVVAALQPYVSQVKVHFVSNLDATHISETLKKLNPETTVFIVASKSFTTQETLMNAITAKEWFLAKATAAKDATKHHFIAVTAKPEKAIEFGINSENIFPIWDWVGGRFSLWSAIGLSIALAIGMEKFYEFLEGAYKMDEHFKSAPLESNMPVILALLSIWNINFLGATSQAIVPYDQYLSLLPSYLQQLEMESNGKHVKLDGKKVDYKTAPIICGAVGTNSQHSFHQLLLQGTHLVPVDFIIPLLSHNTLGNHHLLLYANCLAQSQALMCGRNEEEVIVELQSQKMKPEQIQQLVPHKIIPGNVPSNTIIVRKVIPATLGALLALYEHKVFVEGVIWQINSFDQWGVELGKHLANKLIPILQLQNKVEEIDLDGSTLGLIKLNLDIS